MWQEALMGGGGSDWFYIAVIHAPNGAAVHVDDGDEEIDAVVSSGNYISIPVHNESSIYTITVTMNGLSAPDQTFTTGTTSGQMIEKTFEFAEIDIVYDDEFRGQTATITDGTHTATVTVPAIGNNLVLHVPYTGNWQISAVDPVSGDTFYTTPDPIVISSLNQTVSCHLFVIPDGKTVLPTDDIETWLACGNIKGKSYTTLAEVLADEDTLRKLLTDDNTIDYLKRSTTWAVATGLVPALVASSANLLYSSERSGREAYFVFDDNWTKNVADHSTYNYWYATSGSNEYVGYDFGVDKKVSRAKIIGDIYSGSYYGVWDYRIEYSDDNVDWYPATSDLRAETDQIFDVFIPASVGAHRYWRLYVINTNNTSNMYVAVHNLQFYEADIQSSELAMSYIGAYDYAADTLLGDSTWGAAICESGYVEEVLNVSLPTMTSDTAPSGYVASASSVYSSSYPAYKAFDGDDDSYWHSSAEGVPSSLKIELPSAKKFYLSKIKASFPGTTLYGSNDPTGAVKTTLCSQFDPSSSSLTKVVLSNVNDFKYYIAQDNASGGYFIYTLQFYGREAAGVQTWLKAAGLDRPYTTLAEVLADHNTLAALMSSHDAVDYLVTVKSWIDTVTADETAMRYIGRRNYAADTLLADEDWRSAINDSTYSSLVLNNQVPQMTSNTSPKGTCFQIRGYGEASYPSYQVFDRTTSTYWFSAQNVNDPMIGYEFEEYVKITKVQIVFAPSGTKYPFKLVGTTDGTTWDELSPSFEGDYNVTKTFTVPPYSGSYKKYALKFAQDGGSYTELSEVQFIGRTDVDETTIDIFSAADDTVYYLDGSSNPVTVATTDASGKATIQKSNLPNGEYTLYSTVAKDPDNLSNPYSKQITITDDTMDVMVMPDGAVYWYGYGDYLRSSGGGTVTRNTNYLRNTTGVSQSLSVYFDTSAKIYSKASIVFDGYSNWNYNWNGKTVAYTTGTLKETADRQDESVFGGMQNGTNTNVYAVYCDN